MTEVQYKDAKAYEQRIYALFAIEHGHYKDKPLIQVQVNEVAQMLLEGDKAFIDMVAKKSTRFDETLGELVKGRMKALREETITKLDTLVEGLGTKLWDELFKAIPTDEQTVVEG